MSELNDFLSLIAEAKKQSPVEQVKENAKADLGNIFAQLAEEKRKDPVAQKVKQIEKQVSESVKSDLGSLFAQLASIQQRVEILPEETEGKAEAQQILAEVMLEPEPPVVVPEEVKEETGVDMAEVGKYLTGKTFQQPNPDAPSKDIDDIRQKIKYLEQWLGKIAAHGPGSGEVNFRYLDDVNRGTMTPSNDNWVLEYDSTTKKVQFTENIGPIQTVKFNTSHVHDEVRVPGTLCWSSDDRTMNLTHPNDVIQQVGQETYFLVKNETGSTIFNGSSVRFSGATNGDGQARLLVAPWLADGTYPSLYAVGIATHDIADGAEGLVTNFGKVRSLNTTGSSVSEAWQIGDILYAHPTIAGALTRVKPTAPNNVAPMAAILKVNATSGELFVRPTIYPPLRYATFADKTNQTHTVINTPKAISYNTTEVANGHRIDPDPDDSNRITRVTALVSGRYNYKFRIQVVSTNSAAKEVWLWFRKNGTDIVDSATRKTIVGNSVYDVASWDFTVSMNDNDYLQIMWAVSDTALSIPAPAATTFAPATPSVVLNITEAAL